MAQEIGFDPALIPEKSNLNLPIPGIYRTTLTKIEYKPNKNGKADGIRFTFAVYDYKGESSENNKEFSKLYSFKETGVELKDLYENHNGLNSEGKTPNSAISLGDLKSLLVSTKCISNDYKTSENAFNNAKFIDAEDYAKRLQQYVGKKMRIKLSLKDKYIDFSKRPFCCNYNEDKLNFDIEIDKFKDGNPNSGRNQQLTQPGGAEDKLPF
jgi:hypothetical protein